MLWACRRPFGTVEDMDDYIIDTWNADATRNTLVYVLGDLAWRDHKRYMQELKGRKILIRGNHDRMNRDVLAMFEEVHEGLLYRHIMGYPCYMSHFALRSWPGSRGMNRAMHFYGHSHAVLQETNFSWSCDVGWDAWGRLAPFDVLVAKLSARTARPPTLTDDEKHARRVALRKENDEWVEVVETWRRQHGDKARGVPADDSSGVVPPGGLQEVAGGLDQNGPEQAQPGDVAQSSLDGPDDDL